MEKTAYNFKRLIFIFILLLSWASFEQIPRPEYPRPQFQREAWMNLNGKWDFTFDFGQSGVERGWYKEYTSFDKKITIPFCPESKLSGIHYKDFIPAAWYHRTFVIPDKWSGKKVFLNFGGVNYYCQCWVNGQLVGLHHGGSSSFSFEITDYIKKGPNDLVVMAENNIRSYEQPVGKQSATYFNSGCCKYTRVTGIWQTVWLEAKPFSYIESVKIVPDVDKSEFVLTPVVKNIKKGQIFRATVANAAGKKISFVEGTTNGIPIFVKIKKPILWGPGNPYLYNLTFELFENGKLIDLVKSYAGLRKMQIIGNKIYLNNKPVFLRFVLDQGFYPDGIWTAPSDSALKNDIKMSMAVGFNGSRLHQKVFEERFHYWADKLGYLTWGEFSDWGTDFSKPQTLINIKNEWETVVTRDINHPSIIAWTPLNETAGRVKKISPDDYRKFVLNLYETTKTIDPTRPINDASGYVHVITDIFTIHDYDQSPESFNDRYNSLNQRDYKAVWIGYPHQSPEISCVYQGQPYVVDEYGGTFWEPEYAKMQPKGTNRIVWGYGKSNDQVLELINRLTKILLDNPNISGFCYTQLTDVEQELNGIYTFHRKLKFNEKKLRAIFAAPSALEQSK